MVNVRVGKIIFYFPSRPKPIQEPTGDTAPWHFYLNPDSGNWGHLPQGTFPQVSSASPSTLGSHWFFSGRCQVPPRHHLTGPFLLPWFPPRGFYIGQGGFSTSCSMPSGRSSTTPSTSFPLQTFSLRATGFVHRRFFTG